MYNIYNKVLQFLSHPLNVIGSLSNGEESIWSAYYYMVVVE